MLKKFEQTCKDLLPSNWFAYTMLVGSTVLLIPLLVIFQMNFHHFTTSHIIVFLIIAFLQPLAWYIALQNFKRAQIKNQQLIKIILWSYAILFLIALISNLINMQADIYNWFKYDNLPLLSYFNYFYLFTFLITFSYSLKKPKLKGKLIKYDKNKYQVSY